MSTFCRRLVNPQNINDRYFHLSSILIFSVVMVSPVGQSLRPNSEAGLGGSETPWLSSDMATR